MDTNVLTILAATVPSIVIGIVGFFIRRLIDELSTKVSNLEKTLQTALIENSALTTDVKALQRRVDRLEEMLFRVHVKESA